MTLDELRQQWETAKGIIRAEREKRNEVFSQQEAKRKKKVAEMDQLMQILVAWKDELKPHCEPEMEPEPQPEQAPLLDVPQPVKYT